LIFNHKGVSMKTKLALVLVAGLVLFSGEALAQLNKCKDAAGRTIYTDFACGNEGVPVKIVIPNPVSAAEREAKSAHYKQHLNRLEKEENRQWAKTKETLEANKAAVAAAPPPSSAPKLSPNPESRGNGWSTYRSGTSIETWADYRLPSTGRK
jgi:hypothetical protein